MMRSLTVALALVLQTAEVVGWADSANASSRLGCYRHYGDTKQNLVASRLQVQKELRFLFKCNRETSL